MSTTFSSMLMLVGPAFFFLVYWVSFSPSLSLLCVLGSISLLSFSMFCWSVNSLAVFMLVLILIGGVFILISYTILTSPWDMKDMGKKIFLESIFIPMSLSLVFILSLSQYSLFPSSLNQQWQGVSKDMDFFFQMSDDRGVFILVLLSFLLLSLFIMDMMVKHKGGGLLHPEE